MNQTSELQNELAKVKSDLAALREEFNRVIRIDRDEDGKICGSQVRSTFVSAESFIIQGTKHQKVGMISSDDQGPWISLSGDDDRTRVMIRVTENEGSVEIFGDNDEEAVQIFADTERQGHVAVFSPGKIPRAIMKAMKDGGAITALSPEGQPRALIHSLQDKGEVVIIREKALAKISSEERGGCLYLFDKEGQRSSSLMTAPAANGLFVHPPGGEHTITLLASKTGSVLSLSDPAGEGSKPTPAVELHALPGFGGHVSCRNNQGDVTVDIGAFQNGGQVKLTNKHSGGFVDLRADELGGTLDMTRSDSAHRILHTVTATAAVSTLIGPNETAAIMQMAQERGMFALKKGERLQAILGVADDQESGTIMVTNADNTNAVSLAVGKDGGRVVVGSDDGTTQAVIGASEEGSQLTLFSELGIERASLIAKQDSGALHLRYGGQSGILAAATERGGIVVVHDKEGTIAETLPGHGWEGTAEEED